MTPITPALLTAAAGAPIVATGRASGLADAMALRFPSYGIVTPLRAAHFLGQAAHETEGFKFLREIWGPTDAQRGYEGRADLGNTRRGDGFAYRGRGIFQITGRANYEAYGKQLGLDLVDHPELAEDPAEAVLIACAFWADHGLNALADADDLRAITRKINGGLNGIDSRAMFLARAKRALGVSVNGATA